MRLNSLLLENPVQLLEEAQEAGKGEQRRIMALANIAEIGFEEAYETREDKAAILFAEEVFAPELQAFCSDETTDSDLEPWKHEFEDIDRTATSSHVPPSEEAAYGYLRDCMSQIPDDYDFLVGIHSGGIVPLYAVEDLFDAEPVLLRYSHRDRGDKEIDVTPGMEKRADFQGADVLVLDDVVESGETLRKVGEYILSEGAESVDAVPVRTSMWDMSYNSEMLDLDDGGVKYRTADYV